MLSQTLRSLDCGCNGCIGMLKVALSQGSALHQDHDLLNSVDDESAQLMMPLWEKTNFRPARKD